MRTPGIKTYYLIAESQAQILKELKSPEGCTFWDKLIHARHELGNEYAPTENCQIFRVTIEPIDDHVRTIFSPNHRPFTLKRRDKA